MSVGLAVVGWEEDSIAYQATAFYMDERLLVVDKLHDLPNTSPLMVGLVV